MKAKILTAHDYLVYKLTGKAVTNHTLAAGTLLYDIRKKNWSEEILSYFKLSKELLPEVKSAGTLSGCITRQAAQELGISNNNARIYVGWYGSMQK